MVASTAGLNLVLTPPTEIVGDLLVAVIVIPGSDTVTPPAGWSQAVPTDAAAASSVRIFTKQAAIGDPATYTFTASTHASAGVILQYSLAAPLAGGATSRAGAASLQAPGVFTWKTTGLVLECFGSVNGGITGTLSANPNAATIRVASGVANGSLLIDDFTLATVGTSTGDTCAMVGAASMGCTAFVIG